MILNLAAAANDPLALRDQINGSLIELVSGMNQALIGEVIYSDAGSGTFTHSLGVVPRLALVMSTDSTSRKAVVPTGAWSTSVVDLDSGVVAPCWFLLLAQF